MPNEASNLKTNDDDLQRKLRNAVEYVNITCILGADNKIEDMERTSGWIFVQKYRYHTPGRYMKFSQGLFSTKDHSPNSYLLGNLGERQLYHTTKAQWYYHVDDESNIKFLDVQLVPLTKLNPLFDPVFKLKPRNKRVLEQALFGIATRYGSCGIRASLITKYCWEHPEGIHKIEGIVMNTFDHVLVVINRSGDLKDPDTWGNAWVIDNWYKDGIIFPAKEFKERIKEIKQYFQEQSAQFKKMNITLYEKPFTDNQDIDRCVWKITPKDDLYPSYSKSMRVENYYLVVNGYPNDMIETLRPSKNSRLNMEINWQKQDEKESKIHTSTTATIHPLLSVPTKAAATVSSEQKSATNKKPLTVSSVSKFFKPTIPRRPLSREDRNKIGNEYLHRLV